AFDGEQTELRDDPAACREAARFATSRQYAVTRHDDRRRVFAHRLPDLPRQGFVTKSFSDLAISYGGARRDLSDNRIDAPIEVRQSAVVDCNVGQVALFARKQRNDAVDCVPYIRCWGRFVRYRMTAAQACARCRSICLGKLHSDDTARTPDDAASSDRCFKECETLFHHAANISSALNRRRPIPGRLSSRCAAVSELAARGRRIQTPPAHALRP